MTFKPHQLAGALCVVACLISAWPCQAKDWLQPQRGSGALLRGARVARIVANQDASEQSPWEVMRDGRKVREQVEGFIAPPKKSMLQRVGAFAIRHPGATWTAAQVGYRGARLAIRSPVVRRAASMAVGTGWRGARIALSFAPVRRYAVGVLASKLLPKPHPLYLIDLGFALWYVYTLYMDESEHRSLRVEKATAIEEVVNRGP